MKLNESGLGNKREWEDAGYTLPAFDRQAAMERTKKNPTWIHFGAGNIFRAFQANLSQRMLEKGYDDKGLIVAEGFDYEIIEKMYRPHDNYSVLVTLKADGNVEKTVVASVMESCILDQEREEEFDRLKEIFAAPSLQMATFTITEKGYSLVDGQGNLLPAIKVDFAVGPNQTKSYLGKVATLLYHRYKNGATPIAMVSTDNCSHNGDKLYEAMKAFAEKWVEKGVCEAGFLSYINDPKQVSFPWSMIDKITPRPDTSVEELLQKDGLDDLEPVITGKNTYVAPFVNAEECEYLVIEDAFPNGRPALEKVGVFFTDRETVEKVERMKVCTCLNPLHTALAVFGCLLGFTKISEEMKDTELKKMVERIGYVEGLPVVTDPGILHPKDFIDTVLQVRIPNPFMPDTPQRIATDTSQKLAIRYGETIKNYRKARMDLNKLELIPLVFAGWLRYLLAVDDEGKAFEVSPDPMMEDMKKQLSKLSFGDTNLMKIEEVLRPILQTEKIFGVNLYEIKMEQKVIQYFAELNAGKGAVRSTLQKYTSEKEA